MKGTDLMEKGNGFKKATFHIVSVKTEILNQLRDGKQSPPITVKN